jgi:segregation and condensation protein B
MELSMLRIVGRSEGVGKPMLFGTTREFLVHFGLKTLADLPKPKELEELLESGENKAEARQQLAMELKDLQERAGGKRTAEEVENSRPEDEGEEAELGSEDEVEAEQSPVDEVDVKGEGDGEEEDEDDERHGLGDER